MKGAGGRAKAKPAAGCRSHPVMLTGKLAKRGEGLTAMYSPNQWIHLTCQGTRMGDSGSEGPTLFATYLQSADTYSGEFHAATQKAPRLYYN